METLHGKRDRCPPASLAWREYEVTLGSGRQVTLALSLGDPDDRTMARMCKDHGATNLGLLVVLDDPESVEEVVLWFQQATALTLLSHNGTMTIGDEMMALLPRYFAAFFDEVKDIAPGLADITLSPVPKTGERNLH